MRTLNDIRSTFLDYFKRQGHEVVQSSPLVPRNDPTLMFANSGMVQFKNLFTGVETRDYKRAVTSQKCVRAGGKHNDLDNVGYTARHHTFFEKDGTYDFKGFINKVKNITNSEKGIILFCRTGRRTTAIAKALEKTNDFPNIYNTKGIKEWLSQGNKVIKYK